MSPNIWTLTDLPSPITNPLPARLTDKFDDPEELATSWMADITVYAALMHASAAGIAIPSDCSALSAWQAKMSARPSVKNRSGQVMELPA